MNSIDLDRIKGWFLWKLFVARKKVANVISYDKFGANDDVDSTTTPEDLFGSNGIYTGINATAGEAVQTISTSPQDAGTLVTSGVSTGGSSVTIVDSGASFITTTPISVGDCVINDTQSFHGIVVSVDSETQLTVARWDYDGDPEKIYSFNVGDSYRIATPNGTGVFVTLYTKLIESNYLSYIREYVILNGTTGVNTTGSDYIRNSRQIHIAFGTNLSSVGIIQSYQATTTSNIFTYIPVGHNQSLVGADTVIKGHTLYITGAIAKLSRGNGGSGAADVDLLVRPINQGWNSKIHEYITDKSPFTTPDDYVLKVPEMADYKWQVQTCTDNNTKISGSTAGYLQKNNG